MKYIILTIFVMITLSMATPTHFFDGKWYHCIANYKTHYFGLNSIAKPDDLDSAKYINDDIIYGRGSDKYGYYEIWADYNDEGYVIHNLYASTSRYPRSGGTFAHMELNVDTHYSYAYDNKTVIYMKEIRQKTMCEPYLGCDTTFVINEEYYKWFDDYDKKYGEHYGKSYRCDIDKNGNPIY